MRSTNLLVGMERGFNRATQLYTIGLPVVAHYRWVEFKHKRLPASLQGSREEKDAEWLALDKKYSPRIVDLMKDLKGLYVKYAQIGGSSKFFLQVSLFFLFSSSG